MSTIIEDKVKKPSAEILRHCTNMSLILLLWFSFSAALTLIPNITKTALILLPNRVLLANLPEETFILAWNETSAVVTSEKPDFVVGLYKAGALLVLPARKNGCLALQKKPSFSKATSDLKDKITSKTAILPTAPTS
jgi:hypothetical protein